MKQEKSGYTFKYILVAVKRKKMKKNNIKIPEAYILAHRNESNLVDQYYKHVFPDYETAILELKQMRKSDKNWHIMQFTKLNWKADERDQKIYERN